MKTIMTLKEAVSAQRACSRESQDFSTYGDVTAWELARPLNVDLWYNGFYALAWRLCAAWHVLCGRAMPVRWI